MALVVAVGCAEPPLSPVSPVARDQHAPRSPCARRGSQPVARGIGAHQSSAVALARDGARTIAYVADADERAIHVVDVDAQRWLSVTPLEYAPEQLLVLDDGRVVASHRWDNRVSIFEPGELSELCTVEVASEPIALAVSGDTLAVVSGWGRRLTALSTNDLSTRFTTSLPPEPRSLIIDGERAFVSHAAGGVLSSVALDGSGARRIELVERPDETKKEQRVKLRDASQGFGLARVRFDERERIVVPLVLVTPGDRVLSAGYGTAEEIAAVPFVAVVDPTSQARVPDEVELFAGFGDLPPRDRCILPRAVAVHHQHQVLVACAGSAQVIELDGRAKNPMSALVRRFPSPAGPHAIAVHPSESRAVVLASFAREVAFLDLTNGEVESIALARRSTSAIDARVARGRELFHTSSDFRISKDGRACASCHPDGRSDALTWSTPEGPRQSIVLGGLDPKGPFGWYGNNKTLEAHLTQTFVRLGGLGFGPKDREDLVALMTYLEKMPMPRVSKSDAELVARGNALFHDERQGCGTCHPSGRTDGARHNVKSGSDIERSLVFDTPSLRWVAGSAPYFHDGRYPTLPALLRGVDGTMGHTRDLSSDDLTALQAYLESL